MRNLALYPITKEECIRLLDTTIQQIDEQKALGDTRSLVLKYIKEYLNAPAHETDKLTFDDFLLHKRHK